SPRRAGHLAAKHNRAPARVEAESRRADYRAGDFGARLWFGNWRARRRSRLRRFVSFVRRRGTLVDNRTDAGDVRDDLCLVLQDGVSGHLRRDPRDASRRRVSRPWGDSLGADARAVRYGHHHDGAHDIRRSHFALGDSRAAALLVGATFMAGLSLGITAHTHDIDAYNLVMALFFSTMYISGAFFPLEVLPGWLQIATRVLPLTESIELTRAFLTGRFLPRHVYEAIYLVISAVVALEWAMRSLRRR